MKDNSIGTKLFGIAVTLFVLACGVLYYIHAFFKPAVCDVDKQYLYCHFHPAYWYNWIGCIFVTAAVLFISGAWGWFGLGFTTKKPTRILFAGFIVGILGFILSMA